VRDRRERAEQDESAWGEMAVAANAEWGRLTATRRCEAYDGQACRKIFLREMETYRGGGRLVGPVAHRPRRRRPIGRIPDPEYYR
jgi:hypothetical protein